MSWMSGGSTHDELINNLKRNGIIKSQAVYDAMVKVDRKNFVKHAAYAYADSPQGIGYAVTISAPHMHAAVLELLKEHLRPGSRALDVGSGSGYLTACMGLMVGPSGLVVGIDHIDELVQWSVANVNKEPLTQQLMSSGSVKLVTGDGRLGYPADAPYDAIHVGAASPDRPDKLIEQLNVGGRLVVPVGPEGGDQRLMQYDKDQSGKVHSHAVMGVIYVPLTSKNKQWPSARPDDDL